jgi:uncharacterized membrane protein
MLTTSEKNHPKDAVYWSAQAWETIEQKSLARSSRKLFEEEKQIEEKLLQETEEENCENLASLLTFTPGCQSVNKDEVQE